MAKEVLILTASPRRGGNSKLLAAAFQKGAIAAGHSVTTFDTAAKKFYPCLACDTCWSQGKPCAMQDDFNGLGGLLEQADVLVFASPLYWFSFPSNLKAVIDKLYAYQSVKCLHPLKIKETALLLCGGGTDSAEFAAAIQTYQLIGSYLNWQDRGMVIGTGVNDLDAITKTSFLQQAEELGNAL